MATRTYNKVARAESEHRTREALLDAGEAAFFAGGAQAVSLNEVAAAAGVSKHTLLRHFGSKRGLMEAGFRRGIERVEAERLAAPTDDIEGAVENLVAHYEKHGEQALKLSALDGDSPLVDLARRGKSFHQDWVRHAFGRRLRTFEPRERRRVHAALVAVCDVQSWNILARDLGMSKPEVRATLISALRRLLKEEET